MIFTFFLLGGEIGRICGNVIAGGKIWCVLVLSLSLFLFLFFFFLCCCLCITTGKKSTGRSSRNGADGDAVLKRGGRIGEVERFSLLLFCLFFPPFVGDRDLLSLPLFLPLIGTNPKSLNGISSVAAVDGDIRPTVGDVIDVEGNGSGVTMVRS